MNIDGVLSFGEEFVTDENDSLDAIIPFCDLYIEAALFPFVSDVDTRGVGEVLYWETKDTELGAAATAEIHGKFDDVDNLTNSSTPTLFIATWSSVGYYYNETDKVSRA